MNSTAALFRNSFPYFVLLLAVAIVGFWPTYFAQVIRPISVWDHVHGFAMFGWCAMLIVQSYLIRTNRRPLHRAIGKLSYAVVPLIIVSTLSLANFQLKSRGVTEDGMFFLILQVSMLTMFVIYYAMAIRHRKRSDIHARWMVCTAMPMIDPIFARILAFQILSPEYFGVIQMITYAFTDLILLALVVWDWKAMNRRDVFLPALVIIVLLQLPTFTLMGTDAWTAFASWFITLPIS